jgi:hypothetical protein
MSSSPTSHSPSPAQPVDWGGWWPPPPPPLWLVRCVSVCARQVGVLTEKSRKLGDDVQDPLVILGRVHDALADLQRQASMLDVFAKGALWGWGCV